MKIRLVVIGKTNVEPIRQLVDEYAKRLIHYCNFEIKVLPEIKNTPGIAELKLKEWAMLQKELDPKDCIILLDEKGKQFTSSGFSLFVNQKLVAGFKRIDFVIGGPYGFHDEAYKLATHQLALSSMTFSHQMVRLVFVEQLYRAFTILKGEKYHH